MKSFVAVLALVALAAADVSHLVRQGGPDTDAQIVGQETDVRPDGFQYSYQTSNGISAQESGVLKNVGREDEALEVQGGSSYTSPEGVPIVIQYIANEFGFQPAGSHLPTPPPPQPIPDYILRSLEYNAKYSSPAEVAVRKQF